MGKLWHAATVIVQFIRRRLGMLRVMRTERPRTGICIGHGEKRMVSSNFTHEACGVCRGGCCVGLSVEVYPNDDVPDNMTIVRKNFRYMRKQRDHKTCIALVEGRCSIYEIRPTVCREFWVGNPRCLSIQNKRCRREGNR